MSVQITCPSCEVYNSAEDSECWKCKRKITEEEKSEAINADDANRSERESDLKEERSRVIDIARETEDWSNVSDEVIWSEENNIPLTTSYMLASSEIESEIKIITAEVAYGMHIFKDLFSSVTDLVGGRSRSIENTLKDARVAAMADLKREALSVGADAVIAVSFNYQELSGGGKNGILLLVAVGTAIKVKK